MEFRFVLFGDSLIIKAIEKTGAEKFRKCENVHVFKTYEQAKSKKIYIARDKMDSLFDKIADLRRDLVLQKSVTRNDCINLSGLEVERGETQ